MKPRLSCSCWGSCFSRFRRSSSISLFRHTGNQSRTRLAAFLTAAAAALTFNVASAGADVIYVKHDATGANDGTSWANAHLYLREALARAVAGDDVWVAAGTYRPDESTANPTGDGDRSKSFTVRDGVRLLGGFFGTETLAHERSPYLRPTELAGDLAYNDEAGFANMGENSLTVLRVDQSPAAPIIDGFVVTGATMFAIDGGSGSMAVVRCRFANNSTTRLIQSSGAIANCLFTNNLSQFLAFGTADQPACSLRNCTVALNDIEELVVVNGPFPDIANSVFWDTTNNRPRLNGAPTSYFMYCCVDTAHFQRGVGSISAGPAFVDADGSDNNLWTWQDNDFRLEPCSICVDSGSNIDAPPDAADIDGDGDTAEPMPSDIRGSPRYVDCPVRENGGQGTPPIVDMGAFETIGSELPPVRIFVDYDATGNGDGTSWPDAHRNLNDALLRAHGCPGRVAEIWVAGGTYFPSRFRRRTTSFMLPPETQVYGGFVGTESLLEQRILGVNPTVVSGDGIAHHVANAMLSAGSSALDGITVRDGWSLGFGSEPGAGLLATNGTLALRSCVITNNTTGLQAAAMYAVSASIRLTDCLFVDNISGGGTPGIYAMGGNIIALQTTFLRNQSGDSNGGAVSGCGGLFLNCTFELNGADSAGGAALQSSADFVYCKFAFNRASIRGTDLYSCSGLIVGCEFVNDPSAPVMLYNCPNIRSCTFVIPRHTATVLDQCNVANCIVWTNATGSFQNLVMNSEVRYSCIRDWASGGQGNISSDPLFVDPDGPDNDPTTWQDNDYRLSINSPCIDAGTNLALPADIYDIDGDGDTAEPLPIDLDGAGRRADIPSRPNTGAGTPPIVDMGAFEARCPGDITGDGSVGLEDLATLLANFGRTPALAVEGDLTGDGQVDLGDLAIVLAMFGVGC